MQAAFLINWTEKKIIANKSCRNWLHTHSNKLNKQRVANTPGMCDSPRYEGDNE